MSSLKFYRGPDYLALDPEPQPWVVKPLLPVSGLTNIYGKPKSFKSYLALGMALAIANGEPEWNGFEVLRHGPVAYLQIDTPRGEWAGRIKKLTDAGYNFDNVHIADMNTVPYPYNVLDSGHYLQLKTTLNDIKPLVVVVDTLRESFSGDENDSNTMRDVITHLVAASRPAAMILLSHARKEGIMTKMGGEDLMDDNRGSSYVPGRMDVIVKMTGHRFSYKGRGARPGTVDVEFIENPGIVRLKGQQDRYNAMKAAMRELSKQKMSMREMAEKLVADKVITDRSPERVRKWPEFIEAFKRMNEQQPWVELGEAT
jgi:hypothetical protein